MTDALYDTRNPNVLLQRRAKLSAAAPDLFEALSAIVASTDYGYGDDRPLMQAARAALRKAGME